MQVVTSFRASAVRADQLSAIMAEYMALERARSYRRLSVTRFGLVALSIVIASAGLHWLSAGPAEFFLGLCLAVPAWAWIVELRCDWRLSRRLDQVPERETYSPQSPAQARKS